MSVLLVFAVCGPCLAQTWVELLPEFPDGPLPGPLYSVKPAHYDSVSNRLIVFFPGRPGYGGFGNQVWVLTNANGLGGTPSWLHLTPSGSPPASNGKETVVYDAITNRLIVYGGCSTNCAPPLGTVHVLSNANGLGGAPVWTVVSVTSNQPRAYHTSVFDAASNIMMSFGGNFAFFNTDQNDARVLTNANGLASPSAWTTLAVGTRPGIRSAHTAIYDETTNRMTMFAGTNLVHTCCPYDQNDYNDVWVLAGANGREGPAQWTRLDPTGPLPALRSGHAAVYDPVNNRMLVFGGSTWSDAQQAGTPLGDLWELSHANGLGGTPTWTELFPTGPGPTPRAEVSAAFDAANQRLILLGGRNDGEVPPTSNRVWVLGLETNHAPLADAGADQEFECASCSGTPVVLDGTRSSDPDGDDLQFQWTGPFGTASGRAPTVMLPTGRHEIALTVTDGRGASASDTTIVTISHRAAPTIASVSANPSVLWPPDHTMTAISIQASASDACDDAPTVRIVSVASSEPADLPGDGQTDPDWAVTGPLTVSLRAERSGTGTGRVYTITLQAIDAAGNASEPKTVTVIVPKNQSRVRRTP